MISTVRQTVAFCRLFPNAGSKIITERGSLEDSPCLERDKLSNGQRKHNWFRRISNNCRQLEPPGDLTGLIESKGAGWAMKKIASPRLVRQSPLAAGQLWRMAEGNLQVGMVGKLLVHYKLGKPNAVRVPNSCNCIKTIEKYLKTKKAVLV
jgi:hypothetical protein